MKEQEPKPTIIDQLNETLKKEALEGIEAPTVQSIAKDLGIDERTIDDWLRSDIQFVKDLHGAKEANERVDAMLEKFPQLRFTIDDDGVSESQVRGPLQQMLVFMVIAQTKERKNMIN